MRCLPVVLLLAASACTGNITPGDTPATDDSPDDDDAPDERDAGVVQIGECEYELVSRTGAEPPTRGDGVLGAAPQPFQVHLGLAGDARSSIAIVWRTDDATTATQARFGVAGGALEHTVDGITFRYDSGEASNHEMLRIHEVHVCGLAPDTEYEYQVGGGDVFSAPHRFRTAPDVVAHPDAEVVVAYFGDSRGGYDVLGRVTAEVTERSPDLLVVTGDLVTAGYYQSEWDLFFAAAPELFASVPLVSVNGNHEANAVNYYSLMALPGNEENFSFDYGHLHQVVVNSDPADSSEITGAIATFLDGDLAASTARWNLVAMHRALWSSGSHGSDLTRRAAWGPIIDAHHVDVVVAGHDHIYQRTKPMLGTTAGATPVDGTIYVVSGGAGAPLYGMPSSPEYFTESAASTYNATVVSFRRDLMSAETFRDDGAPLDSFLISKP